MKNICCLAVFSLALLSLSGYTQQARIVIDASAIINKIPGSLYGSCIEDVNHEVYGGLYDQRLYGESFEEPAPLAGFDGWTTLKGEWRIGGGGVPSGAGPGYKLIRNTPMVVDGFFEADVIFTDRGRNAGLIFRVANERSGRDALDGYAVNVSRRDKRVVLGKYLHNWQRLAEGEMSLDPGDSLHLSIHLQGPHIMVYINGATTPVIDHTDAHDPLLKGKVGLRTENAAVVFKNITMGTGNAVIRNVFTAIPINQVSACWDAARVNAEGSYTIDTSRAYTGRQSQTVEFKKGSGSVGIVNSGLNHWGIGVQNGQRYEGYVYLQGRQLKGPVTVALESADGSRTYATAGITNVTVSWSKHVFSLTAHATDAHARFALYIRGGKLWVDQVSLMSSGPDEFKGLPFRRDIGTMMQTEGLTFLRYGGTMVNAREYRWKNMTGVRDKRPPYRGHWYPYTSNGFGIIEFVKFCEAAGFEPVFAVNAEETPEDIGDMVEYFTGDTTTVGGRRRAAEGHPHPYKLHHIEIGNEEVIWGDSTGDYDHYAKRFNLLCDAIHAKNPGIHVVCSAWWRPNSPNMERVFRAINGKAAYWDLHTDADEPTAGTVVDRNLQRMQDLFHQWDPHTTMKCAIFEENGGLHNLRRALGHATTLNAVRRHGDFVLTSCPANALQPYKQNDNDWDQGQIFFTPSQVWGMPPFYAQQMAAANHQPLRIADHTEGALDVTATRSEDGKVLVIHVVNTTSGAVNSSVVLRNFSGIKPDVTVYTLAGALNDENTPENPAGTSTKKTQESWMGDDLMHSFPANSYTIVRIER